MTNVETKKGISRRTVLKTSAWAAPVVLVAAAAPAASASVTKSALSFHSANFFDGDGTYYPVGVQLEITPSSEGATDEPVTQVTVVFQFTAAEGETFTVHDVYPTPTADWTDPTYDFATNTATMTWTGSMTASSPTSSYGQFKIHVVESGGQPVSVTMIATSDQAVMYAKTVPVTPQ